MTIIKVVAAPSASLRFHWRMASCQANVIADSSTPAAPHRSTRPLGPTISHTPSRPSAMRAMERRVTRSPRNASSPSVHSGLVAKIMVAMLPSIRVRA